MGYDDILYFAKEKKMMNHMSCRYLLKKNRGGGEGKRQREGGGSKSLLSKKCKESLFRNKSHSVTSMSSTALIVFYHYIFQNLFEFSSGNTEEYFRPPREELEKIICNCNIGIVGTVTFIECLLCIH